MDGKVGADELIAKVLQDPTLLQALAAQPKPAEPKAAGSEGSEP